MRKHQSVLEAGETACAASPQQSRDRKGAVSQQAQNSRWVTRFRLPGHFSRSFPDGYLLAAAILMSGLAAAPPVRAEAKWKAGAASIDITPQESIWLAGYGNRTKPSEGVLQKIHAKALVLEDETGSKTVLITSDLLGFVKEVSDPIAARVSKKYGIPRERLALNASHTHSAPVIGHMLRPAYPLNPEQ